MRKNRTGLRFVQVILFIAFIANQTAFASEAVSGSTSTATTGTNAQAAQVMAAATPIPAAANTSTAATNVGNSGSTGSAAQGAKDSAASQIMGMGMSVAMGGMMLAQCKPPYVTWPCGLAVLSFAQAAMLLGSSGGASKAGDAMSNGVSAWDPSAYDPTLSNCTGADCASGVNPTTPGYSTGTGTGAGTTTNPNGTTTATGANQGALNSVMADYNKLKNDLAKAGMSLSKDGQTVTLGNGKTVPTSALGSADAAKAAGFSDADIAATNAALASAQSKAMEKMKGLGLTADGSGGGGVAGASGGDGGAGSAASNYAKFLMDQRNKAKKNASVVGMSKRLGNDPIGVAGDDIFKMINRRYEARDKSNGFLK